MKKIIFIHLMSIFSLVSFAQTNATQIEYAIDTDTGVGLNTLLNITQGVDITESILASIPANTSVGYHKLFVRIKDENGQWSHTVRKNIQVVPPQVSAMVVEGEYLLDADSSYGTATPFNINPQTEDITQAFLAQVPANTPIGYHKLYGRVKDSYGKWSQTFRKNIQVVDNGVPTVVEIEYFFGSDPEFGNASAVAIANPQVDGSWTFTVPYPAGPYNLNDVLFVRAKDSKNEWSQTTILDEVDPNLSIGQMDGLTGVSVFPNPFNETLYLKLPEQMTLHSIEIYALSGQLMYRSTEQITQFQLNNLSSGFYLLKLDTNQGVGTYKLIKH
ncbi:MAG: T9SS type A sorting domain-containing protein [Gelidibacter sp.]